MRKKKKTFWSIHSNGNGYWFCKSTKQWLENPEFTNKGGSNYKYYTTAKKAWGAVQALPNVHGFILTKTFYKKGKRFFRDYKIGVYS
jgi:hypothetical protein